MSIQFVDNSAEIIAALHDTCERALWRCGEKAEGYAKDLAPGTGTGTGRLENDISHTEFVKSAGGGEMYVGTNVNYAVYQEMGTGKYAENGDGRPTPWCYQDEQGLWHWTAGNRAHPFIKPAIADHGKTYLNILKDEMRKANK